MPAPPPATASSSSPALDSHHDLLKLVRSHEVALAELNTIPASGVWLAYDQKMRREICLASNLGKGMGIKHDLLQGTVFQRNGNLFFRTTAQKATSYEQKQLEMAKAKLQKLTS
nr:Prefoldin chaperone subunit family protein [Ipomoea batatas]